MDTNATEYDVSFWALCAIANCGQTNFIRATAIVAMALLFLARLIIRGKRIRKS